MDDTLPWKIVTKKNYFYKNTEKTFFVLIKTAESDKKETNKWVFVYSAKEDDRVVLNRNYSLCAIYDNFNKMYTLWVLEDEYELYQFKHRIEFRKYMTRAEKLEIKFNEMTDKEIKLILKESDKKENDNSNEANRNIKGD